MSTATGIEGPHVISPKLNEKNIHQSLKDFFMFCQNLNKLWAAVVDQLVEHSTL
jgi:hypothetical protein